MKNLPDFVRSLLANQSSIKRLSFVLALILGAGFCAFSTSVSRADENDCVVCHKRTQTLTLACNSLEYRRHIDHGDPMMACQGSPTGDDSNKSR